MPSAADRLEQVRARLANAATDFGLQFVEGRACLSAVIVPNTEPVIIAQLTEDCPIVDQDFLLHAQADMTFVNELLRKHGKLNAGLKQEIDRLNAEIKRLKGEPDKDFAAECAMTCTDRLFRQYLIINHGLDDNLTDESVKMRVCSVLAIHSRAELNTDRAAASRWIALRKAFDDWRKS